MPGDEFVAGLLIEVVRIAEDDLGVEVPEFRWGDGLDGALSAYGHEDGSLHDAVAGVAGVGTTVAPQERRLPARKLWIAFAIGASGRICVDAGARRALESGGVSLLAAGLVSVEGEFSADDAVEIIDGSGQVFAKGLVRVSSDAMTAEGSTVLVHADDLVILD